MLKNVNFKLMNDAVLPDNEIIVYNALQCFTTRTRVMYSTLLL